MEGTRIPAGRILRVDMGMEKWGAVIYMVINPPIVCETCGSVVFEWREIDGLLLCPDCESPMVSRMRCPCPVCGEDDYHSLRVVTNNNWNYSFGEGKVTPMNDKQGVVLNVCGKSLMDDIKNQRITLFDDRQSAEIKRKILWTSSMDYDPEKPMPEEITSRF